MGNSQGPQSDQPHLQLAPSASNTKTSTRHNNNGKHSNMTRPAIQIAPSNTNTTTTKYASTQYYNASIIGDTPTVNPQQPQYTEFNGFQITEEHEISNFDTKAPPIRSTHNESKLDADLYDNPQKPTKPRKDTQETQDTTYAQDTYADVQDHQDSIGPLRRISNTHSSEYKREELPLDMTEMTEITNTDKPFQINAKIWILSKHTNLWRECIIRDKKEEKEEKEQTQIRIHYISFSSFYDEWLDIKSERIKLQRPDGFQIGDNLSLYTEQFQAWLEAEVTGIDLENDMIQLMLVAPGNNMEKEWLPIGSPLISLKHKRWDAPTPIVFKHSVRL